MFALTATLGVRTTFFQYWRWADVEVIKVPMRDGQPIQASEVREDDPEIKVGSAGRVMQRITYTVSWCCDVYGVVVWCLEPLLYPVGIGTWQQRWRPCVCALVMEFGTLHLFGHGCRSALP